MSRNKSIFFILIFLSASTIILNSCASKNRISKSNVSFETIYFGKSGGFTNQTEKYALKENGTVYKEIDGEENEINRIEDAEISAIDNKLKIINIESLDLNDVGNMTYFIEVRSGQNSHKITWTEATDNFNVKDLYKSLVSTLQKP
jgi:hypothetical protein